MNQRALLWLLSVGTFGLSGACSSKATPPDLHLSPPQGLEWGEGGPSFQVEAIEAEPYTGSDPSVQEAQERLPTGSDLHSEVILRSCGPLGGVCHNRKEYPDMRTPANFLALINAPCNVQSGTIEGVFDRCERPGDRVTFGDKGRDHEIGWLEVIPGPINDDDIREDMPGLHLHLATSVDQDDIRNYTTARFFRKFVAQGVVDELSYATYSERWYSFDDGRHIVGRVPEYRVDDVGRLLQVGIEQGDLNRNGTYGAQPNEDGEVTGPISMIEPGNPETSYLIARMRGHMQDNAIPGSRMPLANPPFSVAEMISLFCYVEGLPADGQINLESDIDYKNCSYSAPETHSALAIEGAGKNWSDRIQPLLAANCGGCHSEDRAEGDLVLVGEDIYDFLQENSSIEDPMGRAFIVPGDPLSSYLYLKLIGDDSIVGKRMPIDPLLGERELADDELADIEAWITDGAAP